MNKLQSWLGVGTGRTKTAKGVNFETRDRMKRKTYARRNGTKAAKSNLRRDPEFGTVSYKPVP